MANRFVISDTHFGHTNSWEKFKLPNGDPLRPFTSTEEMDETMVERWNAVVRPQDTVYHLGDVVINKKSLHHVKRLNGKKRLVRGNHDIFKDQDYREVGFESLYGVRVFVDKFILSHIPLHPESVTERFRVNVHGHLHANEVMQNIDHFEDEKIIDYKGLMSGINSVWTHTEQRIDPRYLCVSVENTDYRPLSFDEVEARIKARWEATGYTNPVRAWGNGSGPN
jgi:calcineurin-like phosphoesterase family protein